MLNTRESTTQAIAAATLRQVVAVLFERVIHEGSSCCFSNITRRHDDYTEEGSPGPGSVHAYAPRLPPCASDAYLVLQDLCHLVTEEQTVYLTGMLEFHDYNVFMLYYNSLMLIL
jgi:hypothetical protein